MLGNVEYWLRGQVEQNFGDYLSHYLFDQLFYPSLEVKTTRIIGSCIHDDFVPDATGVDGILDEQDAASLDGDQSTTITFWGCGIRERGGLSAKKRRKARILTVRGPVSASDLGLGAAVPLGDPALLLPALYKPNAAANFKGKSICVPHFHDRRPDTELLHLAGCAQVLRPNIECSERHILRFIDAIASADFVLTASLHAAIVAAAYKVPFGFWNNGAIDLPTKWEDFAASINLPAQFSTCLTEAKACYNEIFEPNITLPSLWPALCCAPFLVKPASLLRVLQYELSNTAPSCNEMEFEKRLAELTDQDAHFQEIADNNVTLALKLMKATSTTKSRNTELQYQLATKLGEITQISTTVETLLGALNAKDTHIRWCDERIVTLSNTGDKLSSRFEEISSLIEKLEGDLAAAHSKIDEFEPSINALQSKAREVKETLNEHTSEISRLNLASERHGEEGAEQQFAKAQWQLEDLEKKSSSSRWLLKMLAKKVIHAPRDISRRVRRSLKKRRSPTDSQIDNPGVNLRFSELRKARYRKYLSSRAILAFEPILPRRLTERMQRRMARNAPTKMAVTVLAEPQRIQAVSVNRPAPENTERRILVADYRIPRADVSAGEQATVGILRDLCAIGYDVTFLPTDMRPSASYEHELRLLGVEVVTSQSGFDSAVEYVEKNGPQFGIFYLIRVDVAEVVLPIARRVAPMARIIFHAPDLYFLREQRQAEFRKDNAALQQAMATRDREIAMMSASDHVVLVSMAEAPVLRPLLPHTPTSVFPVLYAPVLVDPPGFAARRNVFFLGGFAHTPNVDSVRWFATEVWPHIHAALPDVEFHIVGAEAPQSVVNLGQQPGIKVIGYVQDLHTVLATLRVGVAPLLFGAGIKGKVATTMGAGIPCVCTHIASEGMGIEHGVHALVEDDPRRFAEAVISLYGDEKLWTQLSARGQALVADRFGNAANRASLLTVLNNARALPIPMFCQYCDTSKPAALLVPETDVDVSIIVPVYNKWHLTRACLASVIQTSAGTGIRYEVILADDNSTDETTRAAKFFPGLRIAKTPTNLGFLRNCNNAARMARGRYLLFLNNDTIVLPGWLDALYRLMEGDSTIGIAGSKLLYPDMHIQEAGGALYQDGTASNIGRGDARDSAFYCIAREVDYVSGASMLVRSDFWREVGGFDERYTNAYCEDSDLAMSARAKDLMVWYQPKSEVIHYEHQSYNCQATAQPADLQLHNNALLLEKWRSVLLRDHLPAVEQQASIANAQRTAPMAARHRRSTGKFNVLYFSPFPSHPSNHGNQATIQEFAKRFQTFGHKVHFAILHSGMVTKEAERDMRAAWDTFDILPNSLGLGANGAIVPFDSWYEDGLGESIRHLCAQYDIDVLFCSYVFQSKLLEFVPSYILKVIDTHDKMGDRYDMLRRNGQPLEFFSCTQEEEGAYLRRADVVVARREEEAQYFDTMSGRKSSIVIPHVEEPRYSSRDFDVARHVGIVASPNRINLAIIREFIEACDRQTNAGLFPFTVHIAGQVKDMILDLPSAEAAAFERPWLHLHGFVPDIGVFYNQMDVVVSPVTMGTGINVKTVQAMAYGMPLLTTAWGAKGIETNDPMHMHPEMDALVRSLLSLPSMPNELRRLSEVSREIYQKFYRKSLVNMEALFDHEKLKVRQGDSKGSVGATHT